MLATFCREMSFRRMRQAQDRMTQRCLFGRPDARENLINAQFVKEQFEMERRRVVEKWGIDVNENEDKENFVVGNKKFVWVRCSSTRTARNTINMPYGRQAAIHDFYKQKVSESSDKGSPIKSPEKSIPMSPKSSKIRFSLINSTNSANPPSPRSLKSSSSGISKFQSEDSTKLSSSSLTK